MEAYRESTSGGQARGPHIDLRRDQAFSWSRCIISIFSYILVSSDVIRSGVGIHDMTEYFTLQPDTFIGLGPYAYPIIHLSVANATNDSFEEFWPYKYDTTSLAMRSVAEHLGLSAWSPYVFYKGQCDESKGLSRASIFSMIDSVVAGVAERSIRPKERKNSRGQVTLRIESRFRDRLHHYALPWIFDETIKRTTQAVHFEYDTKKNLTTVCGRTRPQPYSCSGSWAKQINGFCGRPSLPPCGNSIWMDITTRLEDLSQAYPNHTIDFIVLDSIDDNTRYALSFQGHQDFDVVTLARIRQCRDSPLNNDSSGTKACTTVAVDDYRYESGSFTMNAPDLFPLLALLRVFGQTYMWIRLVFLFAGCFFASPRSAPTSRGLWRYLRKMRVFQAVRTLFLIPNQVIIYGSPTPILAYAVAHLIVSPAVYELVDNHFDSWLGSLSISVGDFVKMCSVSMRTVWTLGLACHVLLFLVSDHASSNLHGAPGISEFSITMIACTTIFAHYRSVRFRNTEVLEIHEVLPSQRRRQGMGNTLRMTRSTVFHFLAGTPLDMKSVTCVLLIIFATVASVWILNRLFPRHVPFVFSLMSRSVVPYSAGPLWLRNRMMISWLGHVVKTKRSLGSPVNKTINSPGQRTVSRRLSRFTSFYTGSSRPNVEQQDLHSLDLRTAEVESMIFLINLAAMTDPITFLNLRVVHGERIGIFESKHTGRRVLLPHSLIGSDSDIPIDWSELELLEVVNSKELSWHQLLSCG